MTRQGPRRQATLENLATFWEGEAAEIGETPEVTIRDRYFRIHELHVLLLLLPACSRLLDVGCGTGLGTLLLSRRADYTLGVDFAGHMIRWAERLRDDPVYRETILCDFAPLWGQEGGNVSTGSLDFRQANLLSLDLGPELFDVIVGQRILINMPSHAEQMVALERLRSHATPESWLLLTESTSQGHARTDAYRSTFDLPPLEKYWHNCYVDESQFDRWPESGWNVVKDLGFATYVLLSKVVYPAAVGPDKCEFLSAANRAAMEVASVFRTSQAVDEIGMEKFLALYVERVARYTPELGHKLESWLSAHWPELVGWERLGHQRLLVLRPSSLG